MGVKPWGGRTATRALVRERLGLQWGEVHRGASELEGVKRPVIEHFSKRRGRCSVQPKRGDRPRDEGCGGERGPCDA